MNRTNPNVTDTTVIIPNYNGLKFMDRCMAALEKQTYTSFCVLIVDNGSTDGSAEYIKELETSQPYKFRVTAELLSENTGFSGAVNAGIAGADTKYVVLLNNDTEARENYLKELIAGFDREEKCIAAVSPKMIQLYHKELLDDAGDGYNLFGWAFQRGVGQSVAALKFNKRKNIFSACAGAAAYRKSALEEVRLKEGIYFDPLHFAYLEDLDISFRLRIHGYGIVYEPKAEIYHVGSGTSGSKYNSFKVRLAARNNIYLNYKNMPLIMLLINLPGILLGILIKIMFFIKRGFGRDYIAGLKEGISTLDKCREHKTFFKASRLPVYIKLELMMFADTFSYLQDFSLRQLGKLKKS